MSFNFDQFGSQQFGTMDRPKLPPLKVTTGTDGDWVVPEEGVHKVIIAALGEVREKSYQGQVQPGKYQIRLTFRCIGGPSDGVEWKEWVGYSVHEKSRLYPLLMALRGGAPFPTKNPDGTDFEPSLLAYVGKPFKAMVAIDEKPSTKNPGQTMKFPKIVTAKPLSKNPVDLTQFGDPPAVADDAEADDDLTLDIDEADPFAAD